jgi:hypothetical protein
MGKNSDRLIANPAPTTQAIAEEVPGPDAAAVLRHSERAGEPEEEALTFSSLFVNAISSFPILVVNP